MNVGKEGTLNRGILDGGHESFLERLFALLYAKNLSLSASREQIAKRLIAPLLHLVGERITRGKSNSKKTEDDCSVGAKQNSEKAVDNLVNLVYYDFAAEMIESSKKVEDSYSDAAGPFIEEEVGKIVQLTWSHCIRLSGEKERDLHTCSTILCVLMSISKLKAMSRLARGGSLWQLLNLFFLSPGCHYYEFFTIFFIFL